MNLAPQPQQVLIVEIRTVENISLPVQQLEKMTVYQDTNNHYFILSGVERIEKAIIEAIPRLGSNYRHPLLYNAQVVPRNEINAYSASHNRQSPNRNRRVRKTNNN